MFSRDFSHRAGTGAAVKSGSAAAGFVQVVEIVGLLCFMRGIAPALCMDNNPLEEVGQNVADGTVRNIVADTGFHGDDGQLLIKHYTYNLMHLIIIRN